MSQQPVQFDIRVPRDVEAGVYSNFVSVWHTPHEFTLDFVVLGKAEPTNGRVRMPGRVVSRVKIPITSIFELLRTVNAGMTAYEQLYGEIVPPEERGSDEEENGKND